MSNPVPPAAGPGCLTEQEVRQVQSCAPGAVPDGLARHLATCPRCQERALFGTLRPARKRRDAPQMPTPTRALVLLGIMVAVMVAFFFTLQQLVGGR